jgi:thiol-disulfide isomerase/thioredoxin
MVSCANSEGIVVTDTMVQSTGRLASGRMALLKRKRHHMKLRPLLLSAALLAIALDISNPVSAEERVVPAKPSPSVSLPVEGTLPSLEGATAWFNSSPLTRESLRGKVVLVDFWTYTCINWQRTQPYVRAWAEKYKAHCLVVIGVHTPEFAFEKNTDNVRAGMQTYRVEYPVAVDSNYAIWRAFANQYWPAMYIVDAQGNIRHHQFGEGGYERAERIVQQLLREAGASGVGNDLVRTDARGSEVEADWRNLRSPENYLGRDRTTGFVSPGRTLVDKARSYVAPPALKLNQWALGGDWIVRAGAIALERANGRILYRFHARDLHLVMGPPSGAAPMRFRVLLDGRPPGKAGGVDLDEQGYGVATGQRLYQLIRQAGPIAERLFEIEFFEPGIEAYAFTFG